jgi:hypothetical protein
MGTATNTQQGVSAAHTMVNRHDDSAILSARTNTPQLMHNSVIQAVPAVHGEYKHTAADAQLSHTGSTGSTW